MNARTWATRQAGIAVLAALGIALHLALRAFPGAATARDWPLFAVLALGGVPLTAGIVRRLLAREVGADLLAAVSLVASAAMGEHLVAAILVLMLSGGETLEELASRRASSVLDALARRAPQLAHRKTASGALEDLPVAEVRVGDELIVLPHELCPVDGVVVEGRGSMDESYLTGEPFLIGKTPGSGVLSGAVNGEAALTIGAEKLAKDSRYAGIMRVMEGSQLSRPRLRRLADRLAVWYIPLTLAVSAGAGLWAGDARRFLAVLVVATPCPLLIAIPVAVVGAISLAAARGIIIKDPSVLERITECRTVILDKTGTLTFGRPSLTSAVVLNGLTEREILALAADLERYSRHPLAAAVVRAAADLGLPEVQASSVEEKPGAGLSGVVGGRRVEVGGRKLARGAALPDPAPGLECVVAVDGKAAALLRFTDAPQPESRPFLKHLKPTHGVAKIMLVSGDRARETGDLARRVGITDVTAEATPERKLRIVREESARAQTLFVGDGINDAPALAAATVGVAMGQGSDVTAAAAGAVIMTASIGKLDELIHVGRRMRAIALQSAIGGMTLSLLGMALAAAGLLSPIQGAVAQELIDLAAVLNAVRVAFWPGRLSDY